MRRHFLKGPRRENQEDLQSPGPQVAGLEPAARGPGVACRCVLFGLGVSSSSNWNSLPAFYPNFGMQLPLVSGKAAHPRPASPFPHGDSQLGLGATHPPRQGPLHLKPLLASRPPACGVGGVTSTGVGFRGLKCPFTCELFWGCFCYNFSDLCSKSPEDRDGQTGKGQKGANQGKWWTSVLTARPGVQVSFPTPPPSA